MESLAELEIRHLYDDPSTQEFLALVSTGFGVGLEIEGEAKDSMYRSFSDESVLKRPAYSSTIRLSDGTGLKINVYHVNKGDEELLAICALVSKKFEDYGSVSNLTKELLANYDKLNIYRGLAEQILQQGSALESYSLLLEKVETSVNCGRCGILAATDDPGELELKAHRGVGHGADSRGTKYLINGTPFEKAAREIKSSLLLDGTNIYLGAVKGEGIRMEGPLLIAPLLYRKPGEKPQVVGFLFADRPAAGSFSSVDHHSISTMSSLASIAKRHFENLETAKAASSEMDIMLKDLMATFESLQQYSSIVEQVNRISAKINSTLDLNVIFTSIADYTRNLLNAEIAVVATTTGVNKVAFPGIAGVSADKMPHSVVLDGECILSIVLNSPKSLIDNAFDQTKSILGFSLPVPITNLITYPIESKGKIAAVIIVFNKTGGEAFTASDADFLKTLAYQATTAIENARLLNDLQQTQFTMMGKLSDLAEKRDPETGEHLLRMQKYSRIIAQEMAKTPKFAGIIDEKFISSIYAASPLHDIGKVAIADNVLLKHGKLNAEEFEIMKTHAAVGEGILDGPNYLHMACQIAGYHHEKWDGSGYPHGAKGEEIPLAARIIAVADVYDALTSKRVYKEDMSHDLSMEIIRKGIGVHFDPDVVAAMEAGMREILTIKNLIR
jgi:response regulator RpfG family c-di-GMP phosphodiesterase